METRNHALHYLRRRATEILVLGTLLVAATAQRTAWAGGTTAPSGETAGTGDAAERVDVENIKQKYWARGDEGELGVVQNRTYTKARSIEFGLFGGIISTDPFLSVQNAGVLLGYHFTEFVAVSLMGYDSFSGPSSALQILQQPVSAGGLGTTANVNNPQWFLGAEVSGSFLYGKLSLLGKAIIHYDMHLLLGLGDTGTSATAGGNVYAQQYFTPYVGIGQQIYLTNNISLRLDYRLMRYQETIIQQVLPSQLGQSVGTRANYTNTVTLGVDFLFNLFGKKKEAP